MRGSRARDEWSPGHVARVAPAAGRQGAKRLNPRVDLFADLCGVDFLLLLPVWFSPISVGHCV